MSELAAQNRLFTRNYVIMVTLNLLACLYGQSMMAMIPVMMNARGMPEFAAGILGALFPLSSIFFRTHASDLGNRLPCRGMIAVCFGVLMVSSLLFYSCHTFFVLALLRIAQGLSVCLSCLTLGAVVAATIPPDRFDEGMGYYSIGVPAMSFLGPAASRMLVARLGYQQMLFALSLIAALALALCLVSTIENPARFTERPPRRPIPIFALEKAALPSSLLLLGSVLAHTCVVSFLPLYAQRYDLGGILIFYFAAGAGIIAVRLAATVFQPKSSSALPILLSFGVCILTMLLLPMLNEPLLSAAVGLCYGISVGILQPHFIAQALLSTPLARRDQATVTYYIFTDLGYAGGSLLWGYISQFLGYSSVFVVAVLIHAATLCSWILFGRRGGRA